MLSVKELRKLIAEDVDPNFITMSPIRTVNNLLLRKMLKCVIGHYIQIF
jgi:hypothetical protein